MGKPFFGFILGAAIVSWISGCALDVPKNGNSLKIIIDDPNRNAALAAPTLFEQLGILAQITPTTTADFNCFAVSVSGSGIPEDTNQLQNCTHPSVPIGILSKPVLRGAAVELDILSGKGRRVDVFGLFPSVGITECGGSNTTGGGGGGAGYLLGTQTLDVAASTTVTVGIAYAGAPPAVTCSGGAGNTLSVQGIFPSGGTVAGSTNISVNSGHLTGTEIVTVGGVPCTLTANNAPGYIQCSTGAHAAGVVDVVVRAADGSQTVTLPGAYTYVAAGNAFLTIDNNAANTAFSVVSGTSQTHTFFVVNTGDIAGSLSANTISGTDAALFTLGTFSGTGGICGASLSAASTCQFTVSFLPPAVGLYHATISLGAGSATRAVTGSGI